MNYFQTIALFVVACSMLIKAVPLDELHAERFCEKFPTLHMCRLREELMGSLVELQYLLQDGEGSVDLPLPDAPQQVQKRKSAFVRLGKRSVDYDDMNVMQKRKSAFVRFGRSFPTEQQMAEKRKSQYIRFGK